jgi:nucleotide-binding universal stress UspA family protein
MKARSAGDPERHQFHRQMREKGFMRAQSISEQVQHPVAQDEGYSLRKIVVAHDASAASERALDDAIFLAKRFRSEILVAHVQSLNELDGILREGNAENHTDLEAVTDRLAAMGLRSREILRAGVVGDTLFSICCEENADLLLLGAYGYGPEDRPTLGSTAEYLLRAIPCPVLTYGPNAGSSLSSQSGKGSILVPISLPCAPAQLRQAVVLAKLFGAKLALLHVGGSTKTTLDLGRECEILASQVRQEGVKLEWSLLYGKPDEVIDQLSRDLDSPFILMPLKWGDRLSSIASDNVAAHVIRRSRVPVMTYRVE